MLYVKHSMEGVKRREYQQLQQERYPLKPRREATCAAANASAGIASTSTSRAENTVEFFTLESCHAGVPSASETRCHNYLSRCPPSTANLLSHYSVLGNDSLAHLAYRHRVGGEIRLAEE